MRVLLYIDSLKAGGAERVTLQWALWLHQTGHEALVLTRQGPERDFYPVPEGVQRIVERDSGRSLGWFGFPWRLRSLRRELAGRRVDLAIGMTTLPAIKLLLAARGLGLPVVVSERNYPPAKPPSAPWRLLRRLAYPGARLHLVQTETIAAWLRQRRLARRTAVLANAIPWPLPRFEPQLDPDARLAPGERLLLAVGTKVGQKGFDRLVQAFAQVASRHPDWRLVVLGIDARPYHGSDQVAGLRALLPADDPAQARLLFPGKAGNVADWYARADLFVLSSRYEGFPNVLLEAMASGCPCLAIDCPTGPGELIHHGRDGWLLPADADVAALADALDRLMGDAAGRRELGRAAVEVRERFAPAVIRAGLLAALHPLVGRP
ncbi:MAG: glycosyltransferase [Cyanobacteriota bacterium]|nr:glycosyltransferase [Cyanobacteriota bacterium]